MIAPAAAHRRFRQSAGRATRCRLARVDAPAPGRVGWRSNERTAHGLRHLEARRGCRPPREDVVVGGFNLIQDGAVQARREEDRQAAVGGQTRHAVHAANVVGACASDLGTHQVSEVVVERGCAAARYAPGQPVQSVRRIAMRCQVVGRQIHASGAQVRSRRRAGCW